MPKYEVRLAKTLWTTVTVEADDEEAALETVFENEPRRICAQCSGWGEPWDVSDDDEWMVIDEFMGDRYNAEMDGPAVKLIED